MIPIGYYLTLSASVFGCGLFGLLNNRKNLIMILICIELMLLAASFNFIAFSQYFRIVSGSMFVFFILTAAAAESAVGLSILILIYRNYNSIYINNNI